MHMPFKFVIIAAFTSTKHLQLISIEQKLCLWTNRLDSYCMKIGKTPYISNNVQITRLSEHLENVLKHNKILGIWRVLFCTRCGISFKGEKLQLRPYVYKPELFVTGLNSYLYVHQSQYGVMIVYASTMQNCRHYWPIPTILHNHYCQYGEIVIIVFIYVHLIQCG